LAVLQHTTGIFFVDVAWVGGVIKMCTGKNILAFLLAKFSLL